MAARRTPSRSTRIVTVGLTQMACGEDPVANLDRQVRLAERAMKDGARIVCTQELFRSQYFCQVEDHRFFDLAEPIPGPTTEALSARWRARPRGRSSRRCSRSARPGSTTTPRSSSTPTARCWASTARCTSRTIRSTTRSSTSRRATRASARGRRSMARSACSICWDQWFPEGGAADGAAGRRDSLLPHRHRLASVGEEASTARRSTTSWETHPAQPRRRQRLLRLRPNRIGRSACATPRASR